jgi:hypothetical protein
VFQEQQKNTMVLLGQQVVSLNTARKRLAVAGTQTAALAFGGYTAAQLITAATEEYDGTSWTTSPGSLNNRQDNFSWSRNSTYQL